MERTDARQVEDKVRQSGERVDEAAKEERDLNSPACPEGAVEQHVQHANDPTAIAAASVPGPVRAPRYPSAPRDWWLILVVRRCCRPLALQSPRPVPQGQQGWRRERAEHEANASMSHFIPRIRLVP